MADVCISYTSSDLLRAKKLAQWFETSGWSVWMDRDTTVGDLWEDTIREKFDSAKAVVVLWCAEARRSKWVLDEAATAHDAGKLVQVQATGVPLPTPFDRINAVRMPSWGGENEHSERDTLLAAVAVKLGVEPPPPSPPVDHDYVTSQLAGIQAAVYYCSTQLEFHEAVRKSGYFDEAANRNRQEAFDDLLSLVRDDGSSEDDRQGIVHDLVKHFLERLQSALPVGREVGG